VLPTHWSGESWLVERGESCGWFEGRLDGPLFEGRIVGYTNKVPHLLEVVEVGRIMGI